MRVLFLELGFLSYRKTITRACSAINFSRVVEIFLNSTWQKLDATRRWHDTLTVNHDLLHLTLYYYIIRTTLHVMRMYSGVSRTDPSAFLLKSYHIFFLFRSQNMLFSYDSKIYSLPNRRVSRMKCVPERKNSVFVCVCEHSRMKRKVFRSF